MKFFLSLTLIALSLSSFVMAGSITQKGSTDRIEINVSCEDDKSYLDFSWGPNKKRIALGSEEESLKTANLGLVYRLTSSCISTCPAAILVTLPIETAILPVTAVVELVNNKRAQKGADIVREVIKDNSDLVVSENLFAHIRLLIFKI